MVKFRAVQVTGSDDGVTEVILAESGRGGDYLMFQREGDDPVYVERGAQGRAARGGIRRCELHRNSLMLRVDEKAALHLRHESEFEVDFDLPDDHFRVLQARLRVVFRGLECFADCSAGERYACPPPDEFAESLERLFVNWFGPPGRGDGTSHDIVRELESDYGLKFPPPLRKFYLRFAKNEVVGQARGVFILPDLDESTDGRFVIWMGHAEDRDGASCGIREEAMVLPDPPVEREVHLSDDESTWVPECRRLSWFVLRTMCWQAACGLPARAVAGLTPACHDRIAGRLTLVAPGEPLDQEILAYTGEGLAVCVMPAAGIVRIGARTTDRLVWLERELGEEFKSPPKSALESKLVGSWAVVDHKRIGLIAVSFEANGRCRVVLADDKGQLTTLYGPYELTGTGRGLRMMLADSQNVPGGAIVKLTVASATKANLVLEAHIPGLLGSKGKWQLEK
jgi:hypothetical protein